MKRICCFVICLCMLFALTACKRDKEESSNTESSITETPAEDFRVYDTESGDGVMIYHYYGGDEVVVIPETIDGKTVTEIDMVGFNFNEKTKELYLPKGVKRVFTSMFDYEQNGNVSALEKVHFPEGLERIENSAFKEFKNLKEINLPVGLKEIGAEVFYGCKSLEYVDIPKACFETGYSVFAKSGIKEVVVPEGVEIINDSMFALADLEKITLPSTLKTLDYYCLYGCPISEIALPDGLETIDTKALGDTKIKELTIPKSVKAMEFDAIFGEKLEKVTFLGDEPTPKYEDDAFDDLPEKFFQIYISKDAKGFGFPRWKGHAVRYFDSDEEPSVEGDFEYIEIENGVRLTGYLGKDTEIIFPSEINGRAVLEIGDYMFAGHTHIREVVFPETLESIGAFSFISCERLTSAEFSSSLKEIDDFAFAWCENITEVNFPETLEKIGSGAFRGCDGIERVVIPQSVSFLGESIFANCHGIVSAEVYSSAKNLGHGLFFDCIALESVILPEHLEIIDDYAFGGSKLNAIDIPSTVKSIGYYAFESTNITEITLPEGLELIDEFAFQYVPISEITLPAGFKTLYPMAFNLCSNLKNIYFLGDAPEILFDDDTWDKPNRVDFTVWYNEGAQGFDGEFWDFYDHAIIGQVIDDEEYLD